MAQSDAILVAGALRGDTAAYGQLYDKYARLVRAICYDETNHSTDSQDLAQEVFLRAHAKLQRLKDREQFGPWVISIAKNVCREYRKKRARDRHILVGGAPAEAIANEVEPPDERLAELEKAIRSLPERERMAIRTFYLQGEDVAEASRILKVSRSSLYRLLECARARLKHSLSQD